MDTTHTRIDVEDNRYLTLYCNQYCVSKPALLHKIIKNADLKLKHEQYERLSHKSLKESIRVVNTRTGAQLK